MKRIMLLILVLCAVAAAQPRCGLESIHGAYAVFYDGWAVLPGSPLPLVVPGVIMGVISIDFGGKLSGAETVVVLGLVLEYEVLDGSVEIKADCTGTARTRARLKGSSQPPMEIVEKIIVLPEDKEIRTIVTQPTGPPDGSMALGVWKRMSAVPKSANW
ncbi:MAG: hypothetical protein AAB225_12460 [Acidobacteriota bacterium]